MLASLRLLVLAAVVALPCSSASASAGAPAAPRACGKAKVRLVAKGPCVKVITAKRPFEVPAALRGEARFKKVAGKRGAARAEALMRLTRNKAKPRAHAAVDGDDLQDNVWRPTEIGGHPGRERSSVELHDGASPTSVATTDIEFTDHVDGVQLVSLVSERYTRRWDACPDANGTGTALYEYVHTERKTATRGGQTAVVESRVTMRGEVRAQAGDDGGIASATENADVDLEIHATGVPTRRYLVHWTQPAPLPGESAVDVRGRAAKSPGTALAGTYRGPQGSRLSGDETSMLVDMRLMAEDTLQNDVRQLMGELKSSWQGGGDCVVVTVDPKSISLAPGEKHDFTVTAKAKDGSPVGDTLVVDAIHATADPHTQPMEPGARKTFTVTMGDDDDKAMVLVTVQGRRGAATVMFDIARSTGWDVTFTGTGTFAKTSTEHGDTEKTTMSLGWTTTFHGVRFDGGTYDPTGTTALTATMHTDGTLGTGSYSCDGTPWAGVTGVLIPAPPVDGATALRLSPFTAVVADPTTQQCQREGYGGTYGNVGSLTHAEPYEAHLTVTPELLTQPEFTLPVSMDAAFGAGESGSMTGSVHFVRK